MPILWLGIFGLGALPILAPFAWSMGNTELRAIDEGRQAESARSKARIGRTIGLIGTVGWALVALAYAVIVFGAGI